MADFSEQQIDDVWNKGIKVKGLDSPEWRKDVAGAWINRDKHGAEELYGWEVDHVYPEAKGGDSDLVNLRPMQWENNRKKDEDYPSYNTVVTSETNKNIYKSGSFTVNSELQETLKELYDIKE